MSRLPNDPPPPPPGTPFKSGSSVGGHTFSVWMGTNAGLATVAVYLIDTAETYEELLLGVILLEQVSLHTIRALGVDWAYETEEKLLRFSKTLAKDEELHESLSQTTDVLAYICESNQRASDSAFHDELRKVTETWEPAREHIQAWVYHHWVAPAKALKDKVDIQDTLIKGADDAKLDLN